MGHRDSDHHRFPDDFNPPTPWGVGLTLSVSLISLIWISIHPPRGGWDSWVNSSAGAENRFQSTHPVGGGTLHLHKVVCIQTFQSTHPVGGGTPVWAFAPLLDQFQSTHPVGGGTQDMHVIKIIMLFQSTHPVGGGTKDRRGRSCAPQISIHPPRGGWDC